MHYLFHFDETLCAIALLWWFKLDEHYPIIVIHILSCMRFPSVVTLVMAPDGWMERWMDRDKNYIHVPSPMAGLDKGI